MRYKITAPEQSFSGQVAGVAFTRGSATVHTDRPGGPAALGYFQRKGYTVEPVDESTAEPGTSPEPAEPTSPPAGGAEPFDPAKHDARTVLAHLEGADEPEAVRVLDAEAAGKARKGIEDQREAILARKKGAEQ
jgi:hypothetical protein